MFNFFKKKQNIVEPFIDTRFIPTVPTYIEVSTLETEMILNGKTKIGTIFYHLLEDDRGRRQCAFSYNIQSAEINIMRSSYNILVATSITHSIYNNIIIPWLNGVDHTAISSREDVYSRNLMTKLSK